MASVQDLPEWWKYFPERWLLSDKVRKMHPIAICGYRFLCDHAMMQSLPGILPFNPPKLRDWARLEPDEWAVHAGQIYDNFEQYRTPDSQLWIGQPFIMDLYRDWAKHRHAQACKGIAGASLRWAKNGVPAPKMPVHADPYHTYAKEVSKKLTSSTPPPPSEGEAAEVEEDSPRPPSADQETIWRTLDADRKAREAHAAKNGLVLAPVNSVNAMQKKPATAGPGTSAAP